MYRLFFILVTICTVATANNSVRNPFQEIYPLQNIGTTEQKIQSIIIPLHYADATNVAKLLNTKHKFLSADGTIVADKNNNTLWVQDYAAKISQIKQLITKVDRQIPQIQISARIVNIDSNFTRELGIEYGTTKADDNSTTGLKMDIPFNSINSGIFNFVIAKLNNDNLLEMELSALESEGHAKVISSPKLITLNRKPAHIAAGEDIPYQEKTGQGNTSTAFKKAVLGLAVTPSIATDNKILLDISVNQDQATSILVNGVPAIQTREIKTQVLVKNSQTIVLGGIYEQSQSNGIVRIPFLGSIPVLGMLFRKKHIQNYRRELLIFITPKIIH